MAMYNSLLKKGKVLLKRKRVIHQFVYNNNIIHNNMVMSSSNNIQLLVKKSYQLELQKILLEFNKGMWKVDIKMYIVVIVEQKLKN